MLLDLSEATAQWFFQKSKDEFDDTSMYLAISYSPDGSIGVSCREQTPRFTIVLMPERRLFHISDSVKVKYRFDDMQAGEEDWRWSKRSAIATTSAYKFADMLMAYNKLIIKIKGGDTMKFGLKRSRATIEKVIAACQMPGNFRSDQAVKP